MGFAWGTGGLSVPLAGIIADRVGIEHTLVGVSVIPLLAAACALPLPARGGSGAASARRGHGAGSQTLKDAVVR